MDNNAKNMEFNKDLAECVLGFEDQQKADEVYMRNYRKIHHDAQNAFRDYIWRNTEEQIKEMYTEPFQIKEYLDEECGKKIEEYIEQLEDSMRSFLRFQELRTNVLTAAYKKIDFIFANKSTRNHLYEKLYIKLLKEINLIKTENFHFKRYFDGKYKNKAIQCSVVWKLQDSLLSEDKDAYYRQFEFDIIMEMMQILVCANGKTNVDEFPKLNEYMLRVKPGYYERLEKQWEKDNKIK